MSKYFGTLRKMVDIKFHSYYVGSLLCRGGIKTLYLSWKYADVRCCSTVSLCEYVAEILDPLNYGEIENSS